MAITEAPTTRISRTELVALLAMMAATVAFSIDAMLPLLPDIAADVAVPGASDIGLVITTFLIGMGLGTLVAGPLSDAHGRHPVALGGAALYIAGALFCAMAQSLETLLIARFAQGIGAAGPRIMAMAIIRDLFSGRQMAQITSFVMTVFALVPVLAPSIGAFIGWAIGWRAIFFAFVIFSVISISWLMLRQPETLLPASRRPFSLTAIAHGTMEVLGTRSVSRAILAQALVYSVLFAALLSSQPVIDVTFGRGDTFYFWFGIVSALAAGASLLNARIVVRLGMRRVIRWALGGFLAYALLYLVLFLALGTDSIVAFVLFLLMLIYAFGLAGLGLGNLNAIAMYPLGHMAGLAASIISAISTTLGALLATPSSLAFDGTPLPFVMSTLIAAGLAAILVSRLQETD